MTRFRVWPALALAAGLLVAGVTAAQQPRLLPVRGQPKVVPVQPKFVQPGQPVPAAAALPVVPKSAAAFISLKVSDVIDHPDLKAVLEQLKKSPEAMDGFGEMFGVLPHEVDRVTLFWPSVSPRGPDAPVVVITTREPFNEARVLRMLKAEPVFDADHGHGHDHDFPRGGVKNAEPPAGAIDKKADVPPPPPLKGPPVPPEDNEDSCTASAAAGGPGDPLFYAMHRGAFGMLFLADDRTMVFLADGPRAEFTMLALLSQMIQQKQTGPLAEAIAAAGNHTFAAGLYLPPLFREFERHMPPELAPYAALTAAKTGTITGDLQGKSAKFTLKLSFEDAAAAKRATPVLEDGLKTLAGKATDLAAEAKERQREKMFAPLLEAAATGLKKATVKTDGTSVVATTEIDASPAAAKAVAEMLQSLSSRKKFVERANNLKQIGLALHNYESNNGHLPGNIYGPKGELLLSWRVQLLPYIEQDNLYKQFKMDEAWDGPNNKKLIEMMPKVFEVTGRTAPKHQTFFQAFLTPNPNRPPAKGEKQFLGRSWLIDDPKSRVKLGTIPDGTSNTIGVVEARNSVIWSKPDDLPFGEKLPPLGEESADSFMVLMLDGSVRTMSVKIKPDTLRILIDTQDGMVTPDDAFDDRPGGRRPGAGGGPGANDPVPFKGAKEEVDLLIAQLREVEEALTQEKLKLELQTILAVRVEAAFKEGAVTKEEVEKAKAELEVSRVRVKEREVEALRLQQRLQDVRRGPGGKK